MNSFFTLLLSNIILAAGLAVIAYAITKKWRSPHLAHGLWLLVLVKLVTPPIVHVPLPQWISPVAITQVVEVTETPAIPIPTETIQELHVRPIPETLPTLVTRLEPLPLEHTEPRANESEPADIRVLPAAPTFKLPTWPQTLFGLWCIGLIGLVLTGARRHWLLSRVIAKATLLQGPLREEAQAIARQLGLRHCPDLRVTTARVCPLVSAGWWNQTILLPTQLLDQLTPEQHRSILTHELSHIRRHDHLVRRFELFALAIHWWNPVAWLASRQLRQAEERCCDAMVVSALPDQRRCYGEALLQTIEFLTEGPTLSTIGASGFGEFTFSQRIETIMKMEVSKGMSWISRAIVLVVAVSVLPFAGAAITKDEGERPGKTTSGQGDAEVNQPAKGKEKTMVVSGKCLTWMDKTPLSGVTIRLLATRGLVGEPKVIATTVSDAHGNYRFDPVAPHSHMRLTRLRYHLAAHHVDRPVRVTTVRLDDRASRTNIFFSAPGVTLKGRVVDMQGHPVAGANVSQAYLHSGIANGLPTAVTNAEGRFQLTRLPPIDPGKTPWPALSFRVEHPEYPSVSHRVTKIPGIARFVLPSGCTLTGVVRDASTGKPVNGVIVTASRDSGQDIHTVTVTAVIEWWLSTENIRSRSRTLLSLLMLLRASSVKQAK